MPPSPAACEVLGCLAPFLHSGPHPATKLRKHTRLSVPAFERAVWELERYGFVNLRGADEVWLTRQGEVQVASMFG
jgi:DNA-binding IclR family transcriptional regulator